MVFQTKMKTPCIALVQDLKFGISFVRSSLRGSKTQNIYTKDLGYLAFMRVFIDAMLEILLSDIAIYCDCGLHENPK